MGMSFILGLMFNRQTPFSNLIVPRFLYPGFLLFLNLSLQVVSGQQKLAESYKEALEYLEQRGEVFFRVPLSESDKITVLSNTISIDYSSGDFIYAYASAKGFDSLIARKLTFWVETPPSLMAKIVSQPGEFPGEWNNYPSFDEYIVFMHKLAESFPEICRLDTIGFSVNKREILALKISDHALIDEPEPDFLYTSTMHGDEPGGFLLLMRLADLLLNQYGKDFRVTNMIDQLQIWINPLSNPDGAYFLGSDNVFGAKRFNINNIDLNRNFPDPEEGPHPDGEEYQPETLAMMEFMKSRHFVLSANLHGGAELVNYPWDTWEKFHSDDNWYQFISRQYADTAHLFRSQYMTDMVNGITNGFAWYSISGGRQDYVNYFLHGREVTLELSHDKIPLADTLQWFWECNYRSLLNYMEQTLFGVSGKVTDRITSKPVMSKIEIPGHDSLNSFVWSDSISGRFSRMLKEGAYDLKFCADGYIDTLITSVQVTDFHTSLLDVMLTPRHSGAITYQGPIIRIINPFTAGLKISITTALQEKIIINLFDAGGRKVIPDYKINSVEGENILIINGESLGPGIYILKIYSPSISHESVVVKSE
jgi:hypothetical protein